MFGKPRLLVVCCLLICSGKGLGQVLDLDKGRWLDLTHDFSEETLYWPTANTFHKHTVFDGETDGGFYYSAFDFETAEHGGTHMDAPIHFARGRASAEAVPLSRLVGPARVIDVRARCAADADYAVGADDLLAAEAGNGRLERGDIVLVRTGFARYWPEANRYLGTELRGQEAVPLLHFPGLSEAAAQFLVERGVAAVGIDTASVDPGQSRDFRAHRVLYAAGIPGFENVADLEDIPPTGAFVIALPMKIRGGSGAPLRIVAFVPEAH